MRPTVYTAASPPGAWYRPAAMKSRDGRDDRRPPGRPSSYRAPAHKVGGFKAGGARKPLRDDRPNPFAKKPARDERAKPQAKPARSGRPMPTSNLRRNDRPAKNQPPTRDDQRGRGKARAAAPQPKTPPKPKPPAIRPMMEVVTFPPPSPARIGDWLLTTRPEAEQDLLDELAFANKAEQLGLPRLAGPALVATPKRPRVELAFARQGFPVAAIARMDDPRAPSILAEAILAGLPVAQGRSARARGPQPFSIDAWVPDDDRTNPHSARAEQLGASTAAALRTMSSTWSPQLVGDARAAWQENGLIAQICVAEGQAYVGVTPAREAPSLAPGGRLRIHLPQHAPSRAAAKLLEAFAWLDRAPGPGEMCVDLGAAPGGWSWVLLDRGAKVLAIDPGRLAPLVAKHRGMTHLRADAFTFEPEEPIDWLVADMAWRPLEAAALYGKWARRGWARLLIANIKLPMVKKAEYLLRVKDILTQSGWQNLRARQLYHDREEVTLAGVRL